MNVNVINSNQYQSFVILFVLTMKLSFQIAGIDPIMDASLWFPCGGGLEEVRKHMADKGFIAELERLQQWRGI